MKVVMVNLVGTGGMAHYNYQLASAMVRHGADVTMLTTTDFELVELSHGFELLPVLKLWPRIDETRQVETKSGRRLASRFRILLRRLFRAGRLYLTWFRLTRLTIAANPDVVQFGAELGSPAVWLFLRWMRRRGMKIAWVCHEFAYRERRRNTVFRHANHLFDNLDVVFVHGETNRRALLEHGGLEERDVVSIEHGNEELFVQLAGTEDLLDEVLPTVGPNDRVILFFGTVRPSKGVTDLLEAFALLPDRDHVRLVIAGYPSRFTDPLELVESAERLGVAGDVVFDFRYVPINEVGALIRRSRMVVLPYRSATQSGALQVAYAFGVPVVATAVGAIPEVVEQGGTGMLVAPQDPVALSSAMAYLLEHPDEAEEMGARARELATTRFSWDGVAEAVTDAFRTTTRTRGEA